METAVMCTRAGVECTYHDIGNNISGAGDDFCSVTLTRTSAGGALGMIVITGVQMAKQGVDRMSHRWQNV
eukprot:358377-Chlamydomonas_euryale.AAC.7